MRSIAGVKRIAIAFFPGAREEAATWLDWASRRSWAKRLLKASQIHIRPLRDTAYLHLRLPDEFVLLLGLMVFDR